MKFLTTLSLTLGLAASANAAVVTFGGATTIVGDSDVSIAGTFVSAFNPGAAGPLVTTTVNGVLFIAAGYTNGGTAGGITEGNITILPNGVTSGAGANYGAPGTFSALTTAYQALVGPDTYANGGSINLAIHALTVGAIYQVQIWVNDSTALNASSGRTINVSSGASSVILDTNVGNVAGGVGQYTLASFQADSADQAFNLAGTGGITYLAGVSIRNISSIPEPSAYAAILGVVALGATALSRRRRLS